MGFVISYESLRDMYNQLSLVMDSIMNERIPKINEVLLEYINEEKIQGKTADTIKKYLGETHGTILQGIYDVSQQFLINFRLYQNGYYSIDSNRDTVINEDYVNFIGEIVQDFVQRESDITSDFIKETAVISDIFTANVPSDWNIKSISDTIKRKNEELNNDIIEYERMQKNALSDVEELICSLKTAIESAKKGVGNFNSPMVDLAIVTENIEKIRQFQDDNKAEINSAFYNQDAILEEIYREEQAKIREEQGVWECVAGVTTVVLGGAAIILSGGAAIPIVLGVATIAFGSSDIIEGTQDVYYGSVGDISSKSFNPLRDTVFFGNQRAYDIAEGIVTFVAGASIPIASVAKTGKVLTSTQKAKIVVSELGKEVIGTGGGFLGLKLGEGLGLSKEESMFFGMIGSIVTSKGADWVDNNWDNLVLAGKYTFSNSGKNVTLGSNGANVVNDFRENFNKVKAESILDVDEIKKVTEGVSKADLEIKPFNEVGKLKPNIKYKAGEYDYLYKTDEMGRINKFETDNLKLTERGSRLPHNPDTPGKLAGDHAGHLAGDRFGGSPELDNLVSQSSNVNLSQYKKIENQWATAIKEGKQVKVNVDIKYDGNGLRPSEFNVKYEIDGKRYRQSILN